MIGIKGIGGGGKTTLARAVYDQISNHFEGKSFVENVREVSKPSLCGLKKLQKRILKDVLNKQDITFSSVHDGKNMLKDMMRRRKTLVVLDDVDCLEQLEALAGEPNWFKSGSRIIITTRDEQVLSAHRVNSVYDVNLLSSTEAICLFSRYAFQTEIPTRGYEELSGQVVQYAHGLPLTIKVLGSFLCGQSEPYWVDAIERLKKIPLKATMERLEISFDGLEEDYKEIFLDVACILKGWSKEDAIRALESCGFHAEVGLRVLEQKSLITFSKKEYFTKEYKELGMHDHLQEMGRNIVRRSNEPQRLWDNEEIEDILANDLGTQATKCLYFDSWGFSAGIAAVKGLAKMKDLRFIHIHLKKYYYFKSNVVQFDKVSEYLPNSLRFMRWWGFPFSSLPNTFQGKYLVELDIGSSNIVQLWEDGEEKVLPKLRFLTIWSSKLRTFDLKVAPNLEQLTISNCEDFVELHAPVESVKLEYLDLSHSQLKSLRLRNTPSLKKLILKGCNDLSNLHLGNIPNLKKLPNSICMLKHLKSLKLESCLLLEKLPNDLGRLESLETLILTGCIRVVELPEDIGCLEGLKELNIEGTGINRLPNSLCMLKHLKSLELKSCLLLEKLPDDIGRLQSLRSLILKDCKLLQYIPNSICEIFFLNYLSLSGCIRVVELPEDIHLLADLEVLNIEGTGISHFPQYTFFCQECLRIVGLKKKKVK